MEAWLSGVTIRVEDSPDRVRLVPGTGGQLAVDAAGTSPWPYRRLTGRRHPEIRRIRQLYRRKRGKRGWKR